MRTYRFPPGYGPEWGSGGIFGLRYHNGVLYYTLAFEAEAHFVLDDDEEIYRYTLVGDAPTSGGDTYNAVETVDEFIYFGGWVHAPAVYREDRRVLFNNKYSHVHVYDTEEGSVRLLWKESIHHETKWAGEVSDIIYNPYHDLLLIAREDGHERLGLYSLDRNGREFEPIDLSPTLKGTIVHDTVFFGVGKNFRTGVREIHAYDMISGDIREFGVPESVDGAPIAKPTLGDIESAYNRFFAFVRGGMIVGNPVNGETATFVRLFDFHNSYGPVRVNALPTGGGILTAYNSHHDAVYQPKDEEEMEKLSETNTIVGPTVLVYVTPPQIRIVGVFGARITSIEKVGGKLLIGTNTSPNTGALAATPFDTGHRDIVVLDEGILNGRSPPVSFSFRPKYEAPFGGIPLDGYKDPRAVIQVKKDSRLRVFEYDLKLPLESAEVDEFDLKRGRNVISLSGFSGIVSFSLEASGDARVRIDLR